MKNGIVYLILGLFLYSCSLSPNKPVEISSLDVANAYFIGADLSEDASPDNNLVKISVNDITGELEPVHLMDTDGSILNGKFAALDVHSVILLTGDYIVLFGAFTFELASGELYTNTLLVNVDNGYVYNLENYQPMAENWYMGSKYHQTDNEGNIYFIRSGVGRICFDQEDEPYVEHYMDYYEGMMDDPTFFVDGSGNVFFDYGRQVKRASGGIINTGSMLIGFQALDGNPIVIRPAEADQEGIMVLKAIIDGEGYSESLIGELPLFFESAYNARHAVLSEDSLHFIIQTGRMDEEYSGSWIWGVAYDERSDQAYRVTASRDIPPGTVLGKEGKYIWIQDGENYYALDLEMYETDDLAQEIELTHATAYNLPPGIEIGQSYMDEEERVYFSAYDKNSETRIIGYISVANGIEYLDADSRNGKAYLSRVQ